MSKERLHSDDRIDGILKDLFYKKLDAKTSLLEWIKNTYPMNRIPLKPLKNQNKDEWRR